MMMGQDEVGSDQTQIIKGKRTKRQRSSSSTFVVAAATTVTSTSSSAAGGRTGSDEYNSAVSSPVTTTDCTEEEEDMAICLIMLARGAVPSPDLKNSRKNDKTLHQNQKISPENSSFYAYECKTCNRTFSSFQALGGHRASHKKPRGEEKTRLPLMQPKSSASEEGQNSHLKVSGSALASQASNIISKANKVHECSICGSEFTSGQALGGHMRRHRAATTTTAVSPAPASEVSRNSTEDEIENLGQRNYLPLDLNLPAPEDDLRESKFQGIVFSATPALIDCHY